MKPITLLQPNLTPKQLNKLMSRRYARLLTLVKTLPSCSEIPGGNALRLFFVFVAEGEPSSLVAGTDSKYGSSLPNAFSSLSPKIFLLMIFAKKAAMTAVLCMRILKLKSGREWVGHKSFKGLLRR